MMMTPLLLEIVAAGIALAGVLLFGFAERLPALFAPGIIRLVGFWCVLSSLLPIWSATESWLPPAILGAACLTAMGIIHAVQTRHVDETHEEQEERPEAGCGSP